MVPMLCILLAYIDPASGSILIQVILAGAVGTLGYFFGPIWRFLRFLIGRKSASQPDANESRKAPE